LDALRTGCDGDPQTDNNRQSQLFLYAVQLNATCFGWTCKHHRAKNTQIIT